MDEQENEWGYTPSKTINFVLAISAILISIASFYATYLQANSAEQQVKAMTYPLMQYTSGNYSSELDESAISLIILNAGVGPAIIKDVKFLYKGESYSSLNDFIKACCQPGFQEYMDNQKTEKSNIEAQMLTSFVKDSILPAGGDKKILQLRRRPSNAAFWEQLNKERFNLELDVCYCSLLEECYRSKAVGQTSEVESCSI